MLIIHQHPYHHQADTITPVPSSSNEPQLPQQVTKPQKVKKTLTDICRRFSARILLNKQKSGNNKEQKTVKGKQKKKGDTCTTVEIPSFKNPQEGRGKKEEEEEDEAIPPPPPIPHCRALWHDEELGGWPPPPPPPPPTPFPSSSSKGMDSARGRVKARGRKGQGAKGN